MLNQLKAFLRHRVGNDFPEWLAERSDVRGLPVVVYNTRRDIETEHVLKRLDEALALIERYQPWHFRRLRRDFSRIVVRRFPCRGAYFPESRTCLVELTFTVNSEFTPAQVAATILHEAMHARIDNAGVKHESASAAKHERFCRRAEVEFGMLVPGGQAIVERALATLDFSDEEVAPEIDWQLAAQRVEEADHAAERSPEWLQRARRRHEDPH